MKDHFFKNITIEITNGNKNRYNAVLDVCREREYPFEEITDKGDIEVLAYFTPTELEKFFNEIDVREEELNNRININLSTEQIAVVKRVMEMLADANICMCHDYEDSGELCAFNSKDGKVYACSTDAYDETHTWYNQDDVEGELFHIPNTYKGKEIYSFFCGGFAVKK